MNTKSIIGIVLFIIGAAMLASQGFSYTKSEKIIDIGPIEATAKTRETVPLPPIVGWVITGAGVVVLVAGLRGRK